MHQSQMTVIVVDRIMQHTPVIPDRETAFFPAYPATVLGANLVTVQGMQEAFAFFLAPIFKACGVRHIHIKHRLAGFGVFANDGVRGFKP